MLAGCADTGPVPPRIDPGASPVSVVNLGASGAPPVAGEKKDPGDDRKVPQSGKRRDADPVAMSAAI